MPLLTGMKRRRVVRVNEIKLALAPQSLPQEPRLAKENLRTCGAGRQIALPPSFQSSPHTFALEPCP